MSSSSSMSSAYVVNPTLSTPVCFCDVEATVRYSNTSTNTGRAFLGCRKYNTKGLPYCKYFKWIDSQDIDQDLLERKNDLLRKEAYLDKILDDIQKREIQFRKMADEIEKRQIELTNINEEIVKNISILLQQQADLRRSHTLSSLFWAFVIVLLCYLLLAMRGYGM
ncbi:hypothetical protein CIPAW_11G103900 [Carya illinoinensis]|uniref:GRF-type domain-containing protein n=1 Tax=Carya illinoinensis TaxID=32201 RepID=A0A8T1P3B5_CARIL|nr:hypothetical protein CIPAW_11G103900 [Carya illinoinensis]